MGKTQLICKVFFRFGSSDEIKSIIGEVRTKGLFFKENEWIAVRTKILFKNQLITNDTLLHKNDICQINVLVPDRYLTIDKSDLGLAEFVNKTIECSSDSL